jgi:L-ascorbate metabolism protein UlaG (beta-lactamase superfamily)
MSDEIRVTYFDTAMVLIEVGGVRLLTDPVLDPAGSAFDYGLYRLEKTSPASVTPEQLGRIDAVLLSHEQHGDNLDMAGRELLRGVPRVLTTPAGASTLGGVAEGLSDWQSVTVEGAEGGAVTVTGVPARHGPDGTQEVTGPVTGFVITAGDGRKVYVSGDTVPFPGMDEIAARYAPVDLAILHLGRVQLAATGDATFSLSADEAIRYAQALGARKVVPIHFEGWAHFTEGREQAERAFAASEIAGRTHWLRSGETAVID